MAGLSMSAETVGSRHGAVVCSDEPPELERVAAPMIDQMRAGVAAVADDRDAAWWCGGNGRCSQRRRRQGPRARRSARVVPEWPT